MRLNKMHPKDWNTQYSSSQKNNNNNKTSYKLVQAARLYVLLFLSYISDHGRVQQWH